MLFNSIHFVLFFPIVVLLYFALPHRFRWVLLLAASYYFYMCWNLKYSLILVAVTLIDYSAGIRIEQSKTLGRRRLFLCLSLMSNLGLLFYFKYFNFLMQTLNQALDVYRFSYRLPYLDLILPIAISFYTFQSMSYTIDIYRRMRKAERHLGYYALYAAYFPKLAMGPIERSARVLPQLHAPQVFDAARLASGLRLMLWGLFKKVVVADRLGIFVSQVYGAPDKHGGPAIIIATYFFAFQIYCDFSGYSDIAIGAARVMGINLMDNFKRPYFAKTIQEFWQRWHISLSSWLRDYLYLSMVRRGMSLSARYGCLLVTFVLCGLWHGAAKHFVFWGALHGFFLVTGLVTRPWRKRASQRLGLTRYPFLIKCYQVFVTFHLVVFSMVFFRANSLRDALNILKGAFDFRNTEILLPGGLDKYDMAFAFLCIAFLMGVELVQRKVCIGDALARKPVWMRWAVYYAGIFTIMLLAGGTGAFIYFQF